MKINLETPNLRFIQNKRNKIKHLKIHNLELNKL